MGASYSFVCCGLLGGALSHPENQSPVLALLDSRSFDEKLKIFGAILGVGFIFFLVFYSSCHWSLDYCGFIGVTTTKNWIFSMLGGILLGLGGVGLLYTVLRRSDNEYAPTSRFASGYNPAPTQPAISMI